MMNILEKLGRLGVIPVVKIEQASQAASLGEALCKGGLPCAEITFRTEAAEETIRRITEAQPGMLIGAGTVLSIQQAQKAVDAGAHFIVSPGFDRQVVEWCLKQHVLVIPGIATPTEALMAMNLGLNVLKFFPAKALGGIPMLEAMAAALPGVRYIPTGGITAETMPNWLKLPIVLAVGGSWLVTREMLREANFTQVTRLATEAAEISKLARQVGGDA
jgi:2-dehydro-3-deoxyphosphogluconate aldolase/(4S)-4-hydroxy-2-oxoglutarate aldolase